MLGSSKNSKGGLFENLEKRYMHQSHNMLQVCRSFLVFYLTLKSTPKMLTNLTRAISEALDVQKL
jgi:hypothetical protein